MRHCHRPGYPAPLDIEHRHMTQSQRQFEMLKIEQVADLLNVSTKTVRRLIEREQLHFHRVGRRIRVSRGDLRAYLNVTRR